MVRDAITHLAPDIPPDSNQYDADAYDNCHWWYIDPKCEEDVQLLLKMAGIAGNLHQPSQDDTNLFDVTRMQINLVLIKKSFRELNK